MRRKGDQNILVIAILTLIIVVTWVGFDIYRAAHKPTLPKILEEQTRKLVPEFDRKTLDNLKKRKEITEENLAILKEFVGQASPSASYQP